MTGTAPISLPNYTFLSMLCEGGMGRVWLAEKQNPSRVAVKAIEPHDRLRSALFQVRLLP